jgi:predicted HTH domain antitoxin
METTRTKCVHLPELNLRDDEIRLLLAMKLLEDGLVSLGKAAEVAGFSEKAFAEILFQRGIPPVKYTDLDPGKELENA